MERKSDQVENTLSLILADSNLLNQGEIPIEEIPNLVNSLKSDEVRTYIKSLEKNSKAEAALREAFFAGKSVLSKYIADDISPEINIHS